MTCCVDLNAKPSPYPKHCGVKGVVRFQLDGTPPGPAVMCDAHWNALLSAFAGGAL